MYEPHAYKLLLIEGEGQGIIRLFASWNSSYLGGESWRMNSGVTLIDEDDRYYYFHGYSGSCYKTSKLQGVLNSYASSVLESIVGQKDSTTPYKVEFITVKKAIEILEKTK